MTSYIAKALTLIYFMNVKTVGVRESRVGFLRVLRFFLTTNIARVVDIVKT